jgi:hypothetical protein
MAAEERAKNLKLKIKKEIVPFALPHNAQRRNHPFCNHPFYAPSVNVVGPTLAHAD